MPTYRVIRGLVYPTNPDVPREHWDMKRAEPGETVDDIPEVSVGWLLESGAIQMVGLPEDFPARNILAEHGLTTVDEVREALDEIDELPGIGPSTRQRIANALEEGGDG